MASKGRKQNVHAALSALVGILQGYLGEKRRQEGMQLKREEHQSDREIKLQELMRNLARDESLDEYRRTREAREREADAATQERHAEDIALRRSQWEEGAPGRAARTERDQAAAAEARGAAEITRLLQSRLGGQPAPGQPAPQPAPAPATAPVKKTGATGPTQRPGTRMPTPEAPQTPLGTLTPGDMEFAALPGMASAPQDAQMAMDVSQAFRVVMGQEPHHPLQVAKAYLFLNSAFGTPVPAWVQQIMAQSGGGMGGGMPGMAPNPMSRQPAMSGPQPMMGR